MFIPEVKDRVLLIGGVPAPGPRQLRPDEKLFDFLLRHEAAVFDQSKVDYEHAEVIRSGQEKPIPVNLRDLLKRADRRNNEKDNVPLKNGDIVFIPPKRESRKDFFTYLASSAPFLFGFL
ncbi:MAG: hypothetical protein FJX77_16915 [Armatimonadetes bacterium]|nr:hypothetical protein [Armatimonadota bacterium]